LEEKINSGRQKELDLARGFAILFMVAVHCLETFADSNTMNESAYGMVTEFFGSFTSATVFMILLGVGIIYSKRAEPLPLIKRGAGLFALGYILNLARGFFPMLLSWKISGSNEWIPYFMTEPFYIDILQFAGIAFVFFGLTKKLRFGPAAYILSLVLFEVINVLLCRYGVYFDDITDYRNPQFYLAAFTGLIWGSSELSCFPFLSWIFYPIAGYLFGSCLIKQDERGKKRMYIFLIAASAAVFVLLILLLRHFGIDYGWNTDAAFYHHLAPGNFVFGSCAFLFISIVFFLGKYMPEILRKSLSRWSRNVTGMYFIQWVLIGWIAVVTDYNQSGVFITVVLTVIILAASDRLAIFAVKLKDRH